MLAASDGLVIFDCDGVLVDSEPISIAVLTETVRRAGGDIAIGDAYKRFLGRSVGAVVADLAAEYGLTITVSQLADMRRDLYERMGGHVEAIRTLDDIWAEGGEYLNDRKAAPAPSGSPWPLLQQLGRLPPGTLLS